MFAFFGLGTQEIMLLLMLLGFLGAVGVGVALIVVVASRSGRSGSQASLEEENRRLQDELDRRRDRS